MYAELEAPSNDVIAMNLTIAAIDRWLENSSDDKSGQEVGREIGAMYRGNSRSGRIDLAGRR